jgi:hypothetical protein
MSEQYTWEDAKQSGVDAAVEWWIDAKCDDDYSDSDLVRGADDFALWSRYSIILHQARCAWMDSEYVRKFEDDIEPLEALGCIDAAIGRCVALALRQVFIDTVGVLEYAIDVPDYLLEKGNEKQLRCYLQDETKKAANQMEVAR